MDSISTKEITKCDSCNSNMSYNIDVAKLHCQYCGATKEIDHSNKDITTFKLSDLVSDKKDIHFEETLNKQSIRCENCGSTSEILENTLAYTCSFCDTPTIKPNNQISNMTPNGLIPFVINKVQAESIYKHWISSRVLAPFSFKNRKKNIKLTAKYYPYFSFSTTLTCPYVGTYKSNKKTRTKKGTLKWRYDEVFIRANDDSNDNLTKFIHPFNKEDLIAYNNQILLGTKASNHAYSLEKSYQLLLTDLVPYIHADINKHAGRTLRIKEKYPTYTDTETSQILLPVYEATYTTKRKTYHFLVNGQTGKIFGESPISGLKIAIFISIVVIVFMLLTTIISGTQILKPFHRLFY